VTAIELSAARSLGPGIAGLSHGPAALHQARSTHPSNVQTQHTNRHERDCCLASAAGWILPDGGVNSGRHPRLQPGVM